MFSQNVVVLLTATAACFLALLWVKQGPREQHNLVIDVGYAKYQGCYPHSDTLKPTSLQI